MFVFISSALQDELDMNSQSQDQSAPSENVVRLRVVLENFKPMMTSTVKELRRAGLLLDTFGLDINLPNESQPALPEQAPHAQATIMPDYSPLKRYSTCPEKTELRSLSW